MERLTKVMSCPNGTKIYDISNKLFGLNISRADKTRMILEKLAEYEDLAEQGRLVILPCKVGETYYSIEVNTKSCEECDFFQKGYYCDDFCENKIVTDEDDDTLINPQYSDKVFCKKNIFMKLINAFLTMLMKFLIYESVLVKQYSLQNLKQKQN